MNYIILYNPLSNSGKSMKVVDKIKKRLEKKNHTVDVGSMLEIEDVKSFIESLNMDDKIVIVGGDGTLHRLANKLKNHTVKNDIYVARKAGTGNDFVRSLKQKGFLIRINDYLENIPSAKLSTGEEFFFLNSVGAGLDSYVCYLVNGSIEGKTEGNYFRSAHKAFKEFKRHEIKLTIDGKEILFNDAWFSVVANSKYFGGGMKISPKSVRNDDILEVVVIKGIPKFWLILIFPTIYIGIHTIFKRWVKMYKGRHIIIESTMDNYVQMDGEAFYPVKRIEVRR